MAQSGRSRSFQPRVFSHEKSKQFVYLSANIFCEQSAHQVLIIQNTFLVPVLVEYVSAIFAILSSDSHKSE